MARAGLIHLGTIGKAHGLRGDVYLLVPRMLEDAFPRLPRVFLTEAEGPRRAVAVAAARKQGPSFLVRLEGIPDRTAAEALRGADVDADRADLESAGCAGPFHEDLVGLEVVTREGRVLGELDEVLEYPAGDLYRVVSGPGEVLLPAVPQIVLSIDWEGRRMVVAPPPGLLEINT